jgi:hypothetical protein
MSIIMALLLIYVIVGLRLSLKNQLALEEIVITNLKEMGKLIKEGSHAQVKVGHEVQKLIKMSFRKEDKINLILKRNRKLNTEN